MFSLGWLPKWSHQESPTDVTGAGGDVTRHDGSGAVGLGAWSNVHPTVYCLVVWNMNFYDFPYIGIYWLCYLYQQPIIFQQHIYIYIWLVVWNILWFSRYWECHHPKWRTPSFFRGVGQPPTWKWWVQWGTTRCDSINDGGFTSCLMVMFCSDGIVKHRCSWF